MTDDKKSGTWRTATRRVVVSLIGGGVFYFLWMAIFLLTATDRSVGLETVLWLSAPVVTALGFTAGILLYDRLTGFQGFTFLRVFVWPLVGCVIGVVAVIWFGPMLIVFGMLTAGVASVVFREIMISRR